jgi:hypothetical protein
VLWCPSECRGVPWCDRFCGGELSDIPPPECWLFDWCWIWWGYPRHKRQEKDGKKCKLLGCGKSVRVLFETSANSYGRLRLDGFAMGSGLPNWQD